MKRYRYKPTYHTPHTRLSTFAGFFLIFIAIVLLFVPSVVNQKISASLIFIGFLIILLINKYTTQQEINDKQLILILILLTWIVLIVTLDAPFDVYLILLAIGIFAVKEVLHEFLDENLQKRLHFLFYFALLIFVIIAVKRIISLAGMYPG